MKNQDDEETVYVLYVMGGRDGLSFFRRRGRRGEELLENATRKGSVVKLMRERGAVAQRKKSHSKPESDQRGGLSLP